MITMNEEQYKYGMRVGFSGGFFFGFLACLFLVAIFVPTYDDIIGECEASLPRDQVCELVAVPKTGE